MTGFHTYRSNHLNKMYSRYVQREKKEGMNEFLNDYTNRCWEEVEERRDRGKPLAVYESKKIAQAAVRARKTRLLNGKQYTLTDSQKRWASQW